MTPSELNQIRRAIIAELQRRGWSDYRLAAEAGRRPWEITRFLRHGRSITTETLEPILDALRLRIVSLLSEAAAGTARVSPQRHTSNDKDNQ